MSGVCFPFQDLTFGYVGREPVLRNLKMQLTNGARCLLIGANGAGKSTILRVLSGRHLTKPDDAVLVLGRNAFHDTRLNFERSYLDTDWGMRTVAFAGYGCPLQADIPVFGMMQKLQEEYPERRDELLSLLGVDLQWRMHQVSDGQRRRVQIFLGLIRPFKILLLDEVTVSLDVVVRQDLLRYLRRESEQRGATILYATHIFDGLDDWPTHLHYLCNKGNPSPLSHVSSTSPFSISHFPFTVHTLQDIRDGKEKLAIWICTKNFVVKANQVLCYVLLNRGYVQN